MACIPTQLSLLTSGQTTLPDTLPEQSPPPQQALAETVGPLVQHDDFQLIDVNASLFDACESQDIAWIKEAINGGADPDLEVAPPRNPFGKTIPVLAYACRIGNAGLVEFLLEHGATPRHWMLMEALGPKRETVLRTFSRFVDIDGPILKMGRTLLHHACSTGNLWAVNLLIELGADVDKVSNDGRTCLFWALEGKGIAPRHQAALIKRLIDAGANTEALFGQYTPLIRACWRNNFAAASVLLDCGANTDPQRQTTQFLIRLSCMASTDLSIFKLLMTRRPELRVYARGWLRENEGPMTREKLNWLRAASSDSGAPERRPRGEPKLDTV